MFAAINDKVKEGLKQAGITEQQALVGLGAAGALGLGIYAANKAASM